MYQHIDGSEWQHIWLVGDLHGCYNLLIEKLKAVKFNHRTDLLLSLGDLIDRGPESLKCLALIQQKWFYTLRGNHEQMAMEAIDHEGLSLWELNGGDWFSRCSPEERAQVLSLFQHCQQLPWIFDVDTASGKHVIAHADYPADSYCWMQEVDRHRVLWDRQRLSDHLAGLHRPIAGADHFWFGHTPLKRRYDALNQHYIDTGAVFGGELSLVQLQ